MTILRVQFFHEISTKYGFDIGRNISILELPQKGLILVHDKVVRMMENTFPHNGVSRKRFADEVLLELRNKIVVFFIFKDCCKKRAAA